jgi:3-oxoacyl-[acyl-carrier protein] reductase
LANRTGAAVVVNYASSKAGAEAVVQRIRQAEGKAVAVQADVSKPDDIRRLFADRSIHFHAQPHQAGDLHS